MSQSEKRYSRLTRNAAGVGTYTSLWLAADHLMIVRSTGYNESYARLQLSDLKGIFLIGSDRRLWWGLGWGALAGLSGAFLVTSLLSGRVPIISAVLCAIGCVGLAWNHLLGPGCRAYIVTGVQTAGLPSLVRRRKATQVIERLRPIITAAQAHLSQDSAPRGAETRPPASASTAATPPSSG